MSEDQPKTTEAEYVRITDLTRLRIVRHILRDVMPESLPECDHMMRLLSDRIMQLEAEDEMNE